ncbi:MAG: hypothetical protein ACPL6C_03010, partial [bacterium]
INRETFRKYGWKIFEHPAIEGKKWRVVDGDKVAELSESELNELLKELKEHNFHLKEIQK